MIPGIKSVECYHEKNPKDTNFLRLEIEMVEGVTKNIAVNVESAKIYVEKVGVNVFDPMVYNDLELMFWFYIWLIDKGLANG